MRADVRFGQYWQLCVVVEIADVLRRDIQLAPTLAVVGYLAITVFEQALQPFPLQCRDLFRIQPLVALILVRGKPACGDASNPFHKQETAHAGTLLHIRRSCRTLRAPQSMHGGGIVAEGG